MCDVGTNNVAKELKKITQGRVKDRNVTWFSELVDKRGRHQVHCTGGQRGGRHHFVEQCS